MSYFHCGNGYPDRCNGYRGPLDTYVCENPRHRVCVDCGHSTAPIWFGQPGSGSHSEDDGSCFDCGPSAKPCPSLSEKAN